MTLKQVAVAILLTVGVGVQLWSCLGVLVMRNALDRLHFTGPATAIGPVAIAVAIIVRESLSTMGVKAVLVAVILFVTNPVLTHATGRAAHALDPDRPPT